MQAGVALRVVDFEQLREEFARGSLARSRPCALSAGVAPLVGQLEKWSLMRCGSQDLC